MDGWLAGELICWLLDWRDFSFLRESYGVHQHLVVVAVLLFFLFACLFNYAMQLAVTLSLGGT